MDNSTETTRKRTQRDYTLAFKLVVVKQVERGEFTCYQAQKHYGIKGHSTVLKWVRKHSKLKWRKPLRDALMPLTKETPAQKIKRLEKELEEAKLLNLIQSGMIDILEQDYGIDVRKKYYAAASGKRKKQD